MLGSKNHDRSDQTPPPYPVSRLHHPVAPTPNYRSPKLKGKLEIELLLGRLTGFRNTSKAENKLKL